MVPDALTDVKKNNGVAEPGSSPVERSACCTRKSFYCVGRSGVGTLCARRGGSLTAALHLQVLALTTSARSWPPTFRGRDRPA